MRVPKARWIRPHEELPCVGMQVWILSQDSHEEQMGSVAWLVPNDEHNGYRWGSRPGYVKDRVLAWWPIPGRLEEQSEEE